ncbi:MAG TPA: hypothetical protein VEI04_05325 [Syntrophobacteria bacterium]|nr:hypothetical protein [Syntrophobacteria bacterium]
MAEPELEKEPEREELPRALPLVLEIMAGQASEGLVDILEARSYEGRSLRALVQAALSRADLTIEERQILEDIKRQLDGGKLLSRGKDIDGTATEYASLEETEAGEEYLYVPVRAIKPQEGGVR